MDPDKRNIEPPRDRRNRLREIIYRTRREWVIAEFIIGVVSLGTAMTGISGGLVDAKLAETASNGPWFWLFFLSGSAFMLISYIESRCRAHQCGRAVLIRYAYLRFGVHLVNMFCWGMAYLWLSISGLNIASITYEALPLAVVNFCGMVEHAKALWLKPCEARTTSLIGAGISYFKRVGN